MGVDYRVWIIPRERSFRPNADQVANLANALREGNWVPKPGAAGQHSEILEVLPGEAAAPKKPTKQGFSAEPFIASWVEFHSQHELVLDWYVKNLQEAGVQYPFAFDPYPESRSPYFYIRLMLCRDYFYYSGETVMPFEDHLTRCACGEQLVYYTRWAPSGRILYQCRRCGHIFNLESISCDVLDGHRGHPSPLMGGLTFRFALVVDCHKYWPRDEEALRRFKLRPEFLDLWHTHIGVPYESVVTFD